MTADTVWNEIVTALHNVLEKNGKIAGDLEPATALGLDLGFGSLELIDLLVNLQVAFPTLKFEDLAQDGVAYRKDLTLGELRDHILSQTGAPRVG